MHEKPAATGGAAERSSSTPHLQASPFGLYPPILDLRFSIFGVPSRQAALG